MAATRIPGQPGNRGRAHGALLRQRQGQRESTERRILTRSSGTTELLAKAGGFTRREREDRVRAATGKSSTHR